MKTVAVGRILVAVSPDGESDWKLLKPEDVPEWIKQEDVMGALVDGNIVHDSADPDSLWYCALRVPDKIEAANDELAETEASAILPAPRPHIVGASAVGRIVDEGGIPIPKDAA